MALGSILGRTGLLRSGSLLSAAAAAAMAEIASSEVVPGANDNLSAVAVLVALARSLAERPTPGVRVLLLSTGSEESFMEGMQGSFAAIAPRSTPPAPPCCAWSAWVAPR